MARAQLYFQLQQREKSLNDYSQAVILVPNSGFAHIGIGDCLILLRNTKGAIAEYTNAIESDESAKEAAMEKRAIAYYTTGEYEDALKDCDKVYANL